MCSVRTLPQCESSRTWCAWTRTPLSELSRGARGWPWLLLIGALNRVLLACVSAGAELCKPPSMLRISKRRSVMHPYRRPRSGSRGSRTCSVECGGSGTVGCLGRHCGAALDRLGPWFIFVFLLWVFLCHLLLRNIPAFYFFYPIYRISDPPSRGCCSLPHRTFLYFRLHATSLRPRWACELNVHSERSSP